MFKLTNRFNRALPLTDINGDTLRIEPNGTALVEELTAEMKGKANLGVLQIEEVADKKIVKKGKEE